MDKRSPAHSTEHIPLSDTEKDPDELVHEEEENAADTEVHDADDLVHSTTTHTTISTDEEHDIDDLMHEDDEGDDERSGQ